MAKIFLSDNLYYCIVLSIVSILFVIVIHILTGKNRGIAGRVLVVKLVSLNIFIQIFDHILYKYDCGKKAEGEEGGVKDGLTRI